MPPAVRTRVVGGEEDRDARVAGFREPLADLLERHGDPDATVERATLVFEVAGQRRDRRRPDPPEDLRNLVARGVVVFVVEERQERRDRLLGAKLAERAPRVDRRPHLRRIRVAAVQGGIGRHSREIRDVLATETQREVVRPLALLPDVAEPQQLGDRPLAGSSAHSALS